MPADDFWDANRNAAEAIWKRGDGGTMSTRLAEIVNAVTGTPVPTAKTTLHGFAAGAAGIGTLSLVGAMTTNPMFRAIGIVGAIAIAGATFKYLEQDRCRPGRRR